MQKRAVWIGFLALTGVLFGGFLANGAGLSVVRTDGADILSPGQVVLHGYVDPKDTNTSVHFNFGLTREVKYSTHIREVSSVRNMTSTILGLKPDTIYYYRFVAQNGVGTSYGDIKAFNSSRGPVEYATSTPPVVIPPVIQPTSTPATSTSGTPPVVRPQSSSTPTSTPVQPDNSVIDGGMVLSGIALSADDQGIGEARPKAGEEFVYRAVYRNETGGQVSSAVLAVVLPPEVDFVSSFPRQSGTSVNGITVSIGNVAAGAEGAVIVRLKPKDTVKLGTAFAVDSIINFVNFRNEPGFATADTIIRMADKPSVLSGALASASQTISGLRRYFSNIIPRFETILLLVVLIISVWNFIGLRRLRNAVRGKLAGGSVHLESPSFPRRFTPSGDNHYGTYAANGAAQNNAPGVVPPKKEE